MQDLATALALVLVLEGLICALFPSVLKDMMKKVLEMPENSLRLGGVISLAIGVLAVWFIRGV